jgi:hypothetical protein
MAVAGICADENAVNFANVNEARVVYFQQLTFKLLVKRKKR